MIWCKQSTQNEEIFHRKPQSIGNCAMVRSDELKIMKFSLRKQSHWLNTIGTLPRLLQLDFELATVQPSNTHVPIQSTALIWHELHVNIEFDSMCWNFQWKITCDRLCKLKIPKVAAIWFLMNSWKSVFKKFLREKDCISKDLLRLFNVQ